MAFLFFVIKIHTFFMYVIFLPFFSIFRHFSSSGNTAKFRAFDGIFILQIQKYEGERWWQIWIFLMQFAHL